MRSWKLKSGAVVIKIENSHTNDTYRIEYFPNDDFTRETAAAKVKDIYKAGYISTNDYILARRKIGVALDSDNSNNFFDNYFNAKFLHLEQKESLAKIYFGE